MAVRPHGISDHYPWRNKMRNDDDVLRYLDDAAALGLRVGLEYDLGVAPPLPPSTRTALHYLIGATHQVTIDGKRVGFDLAGQFVKGKMGSAQYPERERFLDPVLRDRVLALTLELVREGIDDVDIDILGHPTFTPLLALGDPDEHYPLEWQERLIELCVRADVAIEINETYGVPHRSFLERAKRAGARFAVGSDTHFDLKDLGKTAEMIAAAALPHDRFLSGARVRRR